jgi:hypothetical protein
MSKVRSGLKMISEEGVLEFITETTSYVSNTITREIDTRYSEYTFNSESPMCKIMEEDWDNLILLDACRFDQFEEINTISGKLESKTSLGSATPEFLTKNFKNERYLDTVYVTSNPMYRREELGNVFYDVIDVWDFAWDEEYKTVLPNEMVKATRKAYGDFPHKRIFAHFMQPHYPFIGESAKEIGEHAGQEKTYRRVTGQSQNVDRDDPTVWRLLEEDRIREEEVWKAYNENLRIVLDEIEELIEEFSEKTVITSDHGNLVGERITPFTKPVYGHPSGVYTENLRKVPWLILEGTERKKVHQGELREDTKGESEVVSERLIDLGYK